jgi:KEOPS complex subunit Pcc1
MKPLESAQFQLELTLDDHQDAEVLYKSIKPEITSAPSSRTHSTLELHGNIIKLRVKAKDSTSLRAAINSYMRWITLSHEVINLEK